MVKPSSSTRAQNEVYVIQIAPRDPHHPQEVAGLIENIGAGKVSRFSNAADLIRLLTGEADAEKYWKS